MKLGIFGGTFDPPHVGHLIIAQEIHLELALDKLLFVPAGDPPHKPNRPITPGWIRLEMLKAAICDDARFEVSDVEVRRDGPSFTIDTLRGLSSAHPQAELFLVMGADQLAEFASWREPDAIRRIATLVAFSRGGHWPDLGTDTPVRVDVPRIDVSSTDIRRRIAVGEPVTFLVPAQVEGLIVRHGLYQDERRPDGDFESSA